jgi:predicted flap endonuclease-1-like 5' DNA nuclease
MPNEVAELSSCSWEDDRTMIYTLAIGIVWYLVALALGLVAGWVLRSATANRQVSRARRRQQAESDAEISSLRERASNLERAAEERDGLKAEIERLRSAADRPIETPVEPEIENVPDLEVAAVVLGRRLTLDDLRAVNGIGPAIERLCHGLGIRTWLDLATTDVAVLRSMLADAGPRFGMHEPTSWPQQARLLAEGRWDEFLALEARLASQRGATP